MSWISIETRGGDPVSVQGWKLTPFSWALRIRIPGWPGGLIWNRPVSVLAQNQDGREQVIPVVDITRYVQFSLYGGALLSMLLLALLRRSQK